MLAYNLNCWLLLFNREAQASVETLRHHPGDGAAALSVRGGQDLAARRQNGCQLQRSLSEKGLFERLMRRLRAMAPPGTSFAPVVEGTLR